MRAAPADDLAARAMRTALRRDPLMAGRSERVLPTAAALAALLRQISRRGVPLFPVRRLQRLRASRRCCALKQGLNRFNGVANKNLPNSLGWRRALEARGDKLEPPNWIRGAIGNGPYQQLTLVL